MNEFKFSIAVKIAICMCLNADNGQTVCEWINYIYVCLMRFHAYSLDSFTYTSFVDKKICGRSARTITQTVSYIEHSVGTQAHTRTCKFVKKMRNNFENKKAVSLRLPLHCVQLTNRLGIKRDCHQRIKFTGSVNESK